AQESVCMTVTRLIQDLVLNQAGIDSDTACDGILESCNDICDAHSIPFCDLLEKTNIQGHTPHYWVISGSAGPPPPELPPLIRVLIEYCSPLKESTVTDIRLACLRTCDQWLFQSLRMTPEFNALSQTDRLLLGVEVTPDTVVFGPFTVEFEFPHFQQRMRISQSVKLEFVSHARMWRIQFFVGSHKSNSQVGPGQWGAGLALLENSPVANIRATYTIE
ncbi:hypothetical protein DFH07DRAFT_993923, partial [Mycena maculata]